MRQRRYAINTTLCQQERMKTIPPSADASSNPVSRGYWTDQELLEWTGAGSIAIIKHMQANGLLQTRFEKSETGSGQNVRAWGIPELLRVAVVVDLVQETGFNLAVSTMLAGWLGRIQLDHATSGASIADAVNETLNSAQQPQRASDRLPSILDSDRPDLVHLAVVNRRLVYALERKTERAKFDPQILGELTNTTGTSPEGSKLLKGPPLHEHLGDERSILRIKLVNLAARPLELLRSQVRETMHARHYRRR